MKYQDAKNKKVKSQISGVQSISSLLALTAVTISGLSSSFLSGCTGQIPGSFRFLQQQQVFSASQGVNTKIDILWVVDNSSSMDVHQQKLRSGFQNFAATYLQPTWDIQVAVITTDTYLAHPAYANYLNTTIAGSEGYVSSYLSGLSWLDMYLNPSWDPTMVNTSTGALTNGITFGQLNPLWGPNYALLQAGIHDGPIPAFCFEGMPYFLKGVTLCNIRDNYSAYSGPASCVNPNASLGQTSYSQCVNTIENNTVRSGKPIIKTIPPEGTPGDSAWTQQLVNDFIVNASVGSSGSGSERGLSSVMQFLADNETSPTAFFRSGALRVIVFLSDEDDQSVQIPSTVPENFGPDWGYMCDQASLLANNGNSPLINGPGGLCCNTGGYNCRFGSIGTSCTPQTVDGYTYTLGVCVDQTKLIPIPTIKASLDQFFQNLDTSGASGNPNYFTVAITPTTGSSVQAIQGSRLSIDTTVGAVKIVEANIGARYIALGQAVGNGSIAMDIGATDYSPVLTALGQEIVQQKSTYTLARAPTSVEEMIVTIIEANGTSL